MELLRLKTEENVNVGQKDLKLPYKLFFEITDVFQNVHVVPEKWDSILSIYIHFRYIITKNKFLPSICGCSKEPLNKSLIYTSVYSFYA